ncbi:MAG: hypothetical protein ABIF19_14205 [Planctomycetota bacterium]
MNRKKKTSSRSGAALLVVLIIVMAITITSLGFLSRSDVELACGENMVVRTQMDYLAESGLEHARGLILNPQDIDRSPTYQYWAGGTGLQLQAGNDWYDVTVRETDRCNYNIECISYRRTPDGKEIGRSHLQAELRLDPCIAYWTGSSTTVPSQMIINGDVYCGGTLTNNGNSNIYGDTFATGQITGTITGRKNESVASDYPVAWPGLAIAQTYYIGSTPYLADADPSAEANVVPKAPSGANPARIYYYTGNANMSGNVTINGTLVVNGKLTVSGANNLIIAEPNFPALLVNGQVEMKNGASLVIQGLAQIEQTITIDPNATANITVTGALFIKGGGITSPNISATIIADPAIAAIETWPTAGTPNRWGPAAGAFFKSIRRIP